LGASEEDIREEAKRWMAGILQRRSSLKIGVYGSYHPRSELRRLESLSESLRREGYSQTYLVRDLPDLPEFKDDFDKSIFSIRRSNVNVFVLTFRGQKQGAVRELDYVLRNPEYVFKCVAFIESSYRGKAHRRSITGLLDTDLKAVGMRVAEFDEGDDAELLDLVRGTLLDFLYYYIRNRPQDLDGVL